MNKLKVFSVLMICLFALSLIFTSCDFAFLTEDDNGNGNGGNGGGNDGGGNGGSGNGGSGDNGGGAPLTTTVTSEGTVLRGANLASKLAWLQRSVESHNTYIVEVSANENIAPHTLQYTGGINITVILRGDGTNRIIRLSRNGTMFTVRSNVTFVLDKDITLQGHSQNTGNIVDVEGGTLKMNNGSAITGNTGYGGVYVLSNGIFEMTGGTISGNGRITDFVGGGVDVRGTFTMTGGTISGNTASDGGGVYVGGSGTFTMSNGTISGNSTSESGGGVYVGHSTNARFTMHGGTLTGNTAREYGGGVYVDGWGNFIKDGGTIDGYNSDQSNGNVVRDGADNVLARRGHAVYAAAYIRSVKRKETTAGPMDNLSLIYSSTVTGSWDD